MCFTVSTLHVISASRPLLTLTFFYQERWGRIKQFHFQTQLNTWLGNICSRFCLKRDMVFLGHFFFFFKISFVPYCTQPKKWVGTFHILLGNLSHIKKFFDLFLLAPLVQVTVLLCNMGHLFPSLQWQFPLCPSSLHKHCPWGLIYTCFPMLMPHCMQ